MTDAIDSERIEKINKLAKTLKDTGLADTHDKAVEMATDMTDKAEKNIKETIKSQHEKDQKIFDEAEKLQRPEEESLAEKAEDAIEHVEEVLHIKKKDQDNQEVKEK